MRRSIAMRRTAVRMRLSKDLFHSRNSAIRSSTCKFLGSYAKRRSLPAELSLKLNP